MDNNIKHPAISVIMPVYNSDKYLDEAITSILDQTFENFELIIIDDASIDKSVEIIKSYKDDRVVLIKKCINTGHTESLNLGISMAKGEYIARMDSDDISLPQRFEKQIAFMNNNPDVIVCGTNYTIIDSLNQSNHPCNPDDLKISLLSDCYIAHPSVMLRKSVFIENNIEYDTKTEPGEDYDLWARVSNYGNISNLPEPLIMYRRHDAQISSTRIAQQLAQSDNARLKMIAHLVDTNDVHSRQIHLAIVKSQLNNQVLLPEIESWIECLKKTNAALNVFDSKKLDIFLEAKKTNYIKQYFLFRKGCTTSVLQELFSTKRKYYKVFSIPDQLKIVVKYFLYYGYKK